MNHRDHEKLLHEILPPEQSIDFRKASLEIGLAGLRRERRRRSILRFCGGSAALLGLVGGLFLSLRHQEPHEVRSTQSPPPAASVAVSSSHVEFITDDQLLAYYTNQPVALIGKPGEQRLVFLSETDENTSQQPF
jgi:hypothetical protein